MCHENIALCRDPFTYPLDRKNLLWMGRNMGAWVKIMMQLTRSPKTIDIVSYAAKVSVNGVTCVFVVHFRSSNTSRVCKLA